MIHLSALSRDDFHLVANIRVDADQVKFAGTVAEAFEADEAGVDFHGIFRDETAWGFFKIDRDYAARFDFCPAGELGLRAFIVDRARQGQGIGTAAVRALPDYLPRLYQQAPSIALTVNLINPAARAAYLKGGFVDTGEIYPHGDAGPQNILRMPLQRAPEPAVVDLGTEG